MATEKTVAKQDNRTAFTRQPARVLLVDYSPPFDADTCEYLHDALVNFFSLVTHLSGPCRTPFFGLFALTSYFENLFSLQQVRGNFSRLHSAFEELKFFSKEKSTSPCTPDVILQALREAAAQFKRQSQSLRQMSTSSCQLEIIFLTCRAATSVTKHIEKFSKNLDIESIKKIQVVSVQSSNELNIEEDETRSEDDSSPGTDDDGLMDCGLVDVVSLEKDILSFQNFFKTWLLDSGTDQEHLRLTLPSAFTQDSGSDQSQEMVETGLTLKCDLHECLLDPLHLPYQSSFTVCSESTNLTNKGVAVTKPTVLAYPVYNLAAVKLVKTEAICESVLFGMPFIVRPTLCWKLDWEDLESNQQHFHALCTMLRERGVSLLAKTSNQQPVASSPGRQLPVDLAPHGHFLLLPSDNNSLLLKSIAVNELMLPSDVQSPVEGPSDCAISVVASCLDQIELSHAYNPLMVHSDLYKSLISQSLKSNSTPKRLKRRYQAPQKPQPAKHLASSNSQASSNHQTKKGTQRAQVRPVVFTAPKETSVFRAPQPNEFRSAGFVLSTSKRFRQNSAANLYNSSPPPFPDNL